jgi:hypothetical protein
MTEHIIGKEVLITLMQEDDFVNALFLNSFGSRVDQSIVDAMLRISHENGKLDDCLNWAVDTEFNSLSK